MDYFGSLESLLHKERDEDQLAYQKLTAGLNASQRRTEGVAWYPVVIRAEEPGPGDYLSVEVERTSHPDIPHQFRAGMTVGLFSNHDPSAGRLEGTVVYVKGDRMKIGLRVDELPDWSSDGKLGVDLLFDDSGYDEMFFAIRLARHPDLEPDARRLVQVLTGSRKPESGSLPDTTDLQQLNREQQAAVALILAARDVAVVHGPPGTGKTTTLVQAVQEICRTTEGKILVTAPSNAAVDLLTARIAAAGLSVLRIGNPARVSAALQALTLDAGIDAHPQAKEARKLRRQADEYRNLAHKYKRSFGKAEREQRKALLDEARSLVRAAAASEQYITEDLIRKARVITCTLIGAANPAIRQLRYHTAFIDEAGQALEPACWIPILRAGRVVMAGDHHQLPPTIKSQAAAALAETLMQKTVLRYPDAVVMLQEQYRMHRDIMTYPSRVFYGNGLRAHGTVADRSLFEGDTPFLFIDTAGCGFEDKREGTGMLNGEEAAFVWKYLDQAADTWRQHMPEGAFPSVGVIAPYRKQVELLKELFSGAVSLQPFAAHISIQTIDSFQGQEQDVICISMTRSNPDEAIGFLADIQRMNVAMTRARKKLVVIGDSATIGQYGFYAGLLAYAEETGGYRSAWEYLV